MSERAQKKETQKKVTSKTASKKPATAKKAAPAAKKTQAAKKAAPAAKKAAPAKKTTEVKKAPAMTKGATILLNDKQAERFVRSRMKLEDDLNSSRMQRQDAYLHAWRQKAKQKMNADAGFALDLIADLSYYMVADQDLNGLSKLSGYLADYEYLGKVGIDGETKDGKDFREFYPDKDDLNKVVMDLFYEEKTQ